MLQGHCCQWQSGTGLEASPAWHPGGRWGGDRGPAWGRKTRPWAHAGHGRLRARQAVSLWPPGEAWWRAALLWARVADRASFLSKEEGLR